MQSNDLCTALSQTHRGRDLAIGGSVVSAALNQHARVPAHSDPNARKRERPIDHVGDCGRRNSQQCRAEGRSVAEFAPEGEHPDAGAVTSPAAPANVGATPKRRLPIGCESAFGALVRAGNGAARCVTDLAPPNAGGVATDTKPSRQNVIFVKYPRSPFG